MRLILGLAVAAGLACAQNFEIRGTVVDPDLNTPIGDVEISVKTLTGAPSFFTSDARGAFVFHPEKPGQYFLAPRKEGYIAPINAALGVSGTVTAERPAANVTLLLTRPGTVTGQIFDPDGKPVPDYRVAITQNTPKSELSGFAGSVRTALFLETGAARGAFAVTDKEGSFITDGKMPPGDYVVRLSRNWSSKNVSTQFSSEDAAAVDEDFEEIEQPIHVASGATMNAGRIAFRRREPYYRAHVRVSASGCEPGEQWTFDLQPVSDDFTGLVHAQFACTPEVLVRYLKPGSYEIRLSSKTRWGVAYFEITKANVNVDLTLNAQMILNGRVLAAQDAKLPPMDKIKVRLPASTQPDGEGKFTVHKLMWPERSVIVYGLPPQDYVKEIRYNGVAIEGRNFNMAPGEGQQLEIVIDDKAGAITGTVTDADQPFPSAQVVVVKWPPPDGNAAPALASATADSSGRFQIAGLAPGEYRVIAFARGTDPGPTEQLKQEIASSERVSLDPGGSQSVALKISGR